MAKSRKQILGFFLVIIVFAAVLALVAQGAGNQVTTDSIGVLELSQVREKFPAYVKLKGHETQYQTELNAFAASQRTVLANYYSDLQKQLEAETVGKTDAEKQDINNKYSKLAQDKSTEISQLTQAKAQEYQNKLNEESVKAKQALDATISAYGAEKKFTLILSKNVYDPVNRIYFDMVYYGGKDVTADVIAKGSK